jgi:hypothetical protein
MDSTATLKYNAYTYQNGEFRKFEALGSVTKQVRDTECRCTLIALIPFNNE